MERNSSNNSMYCFSRRLQIGESCQKPPGQRDIEHDNGKWKQRSHNHDRSFVDSHEQQQRERRTSPAGQCL